MPRPTNCLQTLEEAEAWVQFLGEQEEYFLLAALLRSFRARRAFPEAHKAADLAGYILEEQ